MVREYASAKELSVASPTLPSSSSFSSSSSSSSTPSATSPVSSLDSSYLKASSASYMHDDAYHIHHPDLSNLTLAPPTNSSSDQKERKEYQPASGSVSPAGGLSPRVQEEDVEELKYMFFLNWLRTNGARFPHLTLRRYAKDYRGVHIASPAQPSQPSSPITKGKTLLRIPHRLLITVELARSTPLGALISQLPNIGSQAILACYLIQEKRKGADSFWHHWLQVLPATFDTLPMFFGDADLAELEGCNELLVKVRSQQRSMRDEYNSIVRLPGVSAIAQFSYDEFVWAALAVGTRVFSLCINNAKTSVLAPLADMMNHKNPAGSSWSYCNRKEAFTLTACCSMAAGEAVYESYGVKDNKRFFASYGFCLEDNPANEASVCIKGELMVDERQSRAFTVRAHYDSAMEELLSFLRMCNAYEYQMDEAGGMARSTTPSTPSSNTSASSSAFSAYTRSSFSVPLSIDNELSALYALRCACKEHLSLYPTKLEHDAQLLARLDADGDDGGNMRNILVFRMGEKRIYRWLIDFSTVAIGLLCQPWDEARLRIKDMMERGGAEAATGDELSGMMAYVSGVVAPLLQERSKLRRGGGGVSGGLSDRSARRMMHDTDRRAMASASAGVGGDSVMDYSRDMQSDTSDDDEEDDDHAVDSGSSSSEKDGAAGSVGGMTAGQYLHHFNTATSDDTLSATMRSILAEVSSSISASASSHGASASSAASSKRSSLTSLPALPPVPALRSQGSSTRSSFVANPSFSPQLSPSSSPTSSYSTRHIPRSVASARSAAPRLLPAMPPVSRASSHSSSLAAVSASAPATTTSSPPNRSSISLLPGTIPALPSSSSRLPSMLPASSASATTTSSSSYLTPKSRRSSGTITGGSKLSPARANPPPVLHSAPSPTPSTSDDSADDGTPVDEADESDDGEAGVHYSGKDKMSGGGVGKERERRRSGAMKHCASS